MAHTYLSLEEIMDKLPSEGDPIATFGLSLARVYSFNKNGRFAPAIKNLADLYRRKAIRQRDENVETEWQGPREVEHHYLGGAKSTEMVQGPLKTIRRNSIFMTCALYDFINQRQEIASFLKQYFEEHQFSQNNLIGSFYSDANYSPSVNLILSLIASREEGIAYAPKIVRAIADLKKDKKIRAIVNLDSLEEDIGRLKAYIRKGEFLDMSNSLAEAATPVLITMLNRLRGSAEEREEELGEMFNKAYLLPLIQKMKNGEREKGYLTIRGLERLK